MSKRDRTGKERETTRKRRRGNAEYDRSHTQDTRAPHRKLRRRCAREERRQRERGKSRDNHLNKDKKRGKIEDGEKEGSHRTESGEKTRDMKGGRRKSRDRERIEDTRHGGRRGHRERGVQDKEQEEGKDK